jgi:hypothetical protein
MFEMEPSAFVTDRILLCAMPYFGPLGRESNAEIVVDRKSHLVGYEGHQGTNNYAYF